MTTPISWFDVLERVRPALGITLTLGDPTVAEAVAASGADWLMADLEHTGLTTRDIEGITLAAQVVGVPVLARVAENRLDDVQHALDAGAAGVIVPRVSSAAEARRALSYARYPPDGARGFGPRRANQYGKDPTYVERANRDIALIVQVETAGAVADLDEIVQVPLSAVYVGPNDLAASLGYIGQPGHPEVVKAIERIIDTARGAGMQVGVAIGDAAGARQYVERGASFLGVGGDIWLLSGAVGSLVASHRTASEWAGGRTSY